MAVSPAQRDLAKGARIAITTLGTRGDVQPYIALARGLLARGHSVILLAPEQFADLVAEYGVPFAPLPGDILALIDTPEAKQAVAGSDGFGAGLKLLKFMPPLARKLLAAEWAALRAFSPDMILYHPKSFGAVHMAEALDCRCILASPLPGFTPTADFPTPLLPFQSLGPLNKISHVLGTHSARTLFGKIIRHLRTQVLGLGRKGKGQTPSGTLYAYSPNVIPVPRDWGQDVKVSGYWFLDNPDWEMPGDLTSFLDQGPAPVYIGFGSMPGLDPERTTAIVIDALERVGKRGLLATAGGAIAQRDVPDTIKIIAGAPHDRLFRHVSATVHHGGAGTTGAALRAGKPTTICPHFGDQPFWGRRIAKLGVGPAPIFKKHFSVETLSAAVRAMDDGDMKRRAADLGAAIEKEDGVATAIAFIEDRLCRP